MDPRDRADALLARARSRGTHIVTPDNMTSPMDSSATQQVPRAVVDAIDQPEMDPDSTMVLSASVAAGNPAPQPRQEPQGRVAPGPVPTVQQESATRPSLTQRLSGDV